MLIIHLLMASALIRLAAPFIRRAAAINDLRNPKISQPVTIDKTEKIKGCWLPEEVDAVCAGDPEVLKRGQERFEVVEKARKSWLHSMN